MPGPIDTGGDTDNIQQTEVVARLLRGELGMREACERYGLTPDALGDCVRDFRRSTLKAFDEHVHATLSRQGVDTAAFSATELTGTLDEVTVSDLIQTMELTRRDCEIRVTHAGMASRLWCSGGEIVAAESGKLAGEPALYRILALDEGQVVADFRPVRSQRTIWKATAVLLLDGARRKDECNRLRGRLGNERYAPCSKLMSPAVTLTPEEQELLRGFEGPRRVEDVIAASTLGDLETLTTFANLVRRECLLPAASADTALPAASANAKSLHPVSVSLLAFAPGASRPRRVAARHLRFGLIVAGSLMAVASVRWLLSAGSVSVPDTARDSRALAAIPVVLAPEAGSEARVHASLPAAISATPAQAVASAPTPDLPQPPLEPALAPALMPATLIVSRPLARTPDASAPSASRARVRAARARRAGGAAMEPAAPPEPPLLPRMEIIHDRNPTMRILE